MPTMACIDCDEFVAEADSWQAMLVEMVKHYFEAHHDIIAGHRDHPKGAWMERFMAAYREAEAADEPSGPAGQRMA